MSSGIKFIKLDQNHGRCFWSRLISNDTNMVSTIDYKETIETDARLNLDSNTACL